MLAHFAHVYIYSLDAAAVSHNKLDKFMLQILNQLHLF
jgi:hypothetical protein